MKIILIIIFSGFALNLYAQFKLQWYSIYDNPHPSYIDFAVDLVEDDFGNTYVTGTSFQINLTDDWRYDFATIKYNSEGDSLWVKRYDSFSEDRAVGIGIDNQNNIYVGGNSYTSNRYGTIIKYDTDGNEIWVKAFYDSTLTAYLRMYDMLVDSEGNVFLAFSYYRGSNISELVKLNTNGEVIWTTKYSTGEFNINQILSITLDKSGNLYATGFARDSGSSNSDYLTLKYDPQGNLLWEARTDQTSDDIGYCIKTDDFGNTYVAGYSFTDNINYDMKLLKYNSSGEQQWVRSYSGGKESISFMKYNKKKMVAIDGSGDVYVSFTTFNNNTNDIATNKYSPSGELLWNNIFGLEPEISYEDAIDIKLDKFDNVYAAGSRYEYLNEQNSFVILKYDNNGGLQKVIRNDGLFPQSFHPVAIVVNSIGDVTATGSSLSLSNPHETDYFTVKYSTSTGIHSTSNLSPPTFILNQNYPNPFNPSTDLGFGISELGFVSLKVYDVLGNEISTLVNEKMPAGNYNYQFSTVDYQLSSGIYFYSLTVDGVLIDTKRMVLLK